MDILDEFFTSEENQIKYGFEYYKEESGFSSIIFDGDLNALMKTAYEACGFIEVKKENAVDDARPVLDIQVNADGMLILKDTADLIDVDVDWEGSEPNFFIRFGRGNDIKTIRFNMQKPELYPDNKSSDYRFSNSSLSAINDFFGRHFPFLIWKWNSMKDTVFDLEQIPNYRAINRII